MTLYPSISTTQNNFVVLEIRERKLFCFSRPKSRSSNCKRVRSAMALSVITLRDGLRFMVVLMMCCAILAHISAMDETREAQRRVEADSAAETGELKQSLLYRGRRAVQKNSTPNLTEVEKRLKSMEERYV